MALVDFFAFWIRFVFENERWKQEYFCPEKRWQFLASTFLVKVISDIKFRVLEEDEDEEVN